jgi:hypothetical protein
MLFENASRANAELKADSDSHPLLYSGPLLSGQKQTSLSCPHAVRFAPKADIGERRTVSASCHKEMSAYTGGTCLNAPAPSINAILFFCVHCHQGGSMDPVNSGKLMLLSGLNGRARNTIVTGASIAVNSFKLCRRSAAGRSTLAAVKEEWHGA